MYSCSGPQCDSDLKLLISGRVLLDGRQRRSHEAATSLEVTFSWIPLCWSFVFSCQSMTQSGDGIFMWNQQLALQESDTEPTKSKRSQYPRSVFFIIGNEFCERFSYYGMRGEYRWNVRWVQMECEVSRLQIQLATHDSTWQSVGDNMHFLLLAAILVIYLTDWLSFSQNLATAIYHSFIVLCYLMPLFGAMIADGWLGKYRCAFTSTARPSFLRKDVSLSWQGSRASKKQSFEYL